MATLDINRTYRQGAILLEADLDYVTDGLEEFLNTIKINDDNIQSNSLDASAKFIDDSVITALFEDSAVTTAKIADSAVTTAKIVNSAVTAAKIADSAVTTAKIADSAVTTAKIADDSITLPKLVNINQYSATTTQTENTTAAPGADISTSLSVTVSAQARKLLVALNSTSVSDSTPSIVDTNASVLIGGRTSVAVDKDMEIILLRDGSELITWYICKNLQVLGDNSYVPNTYNYGIGLPPGAFWYIDVPTPGATHTYTIKLNYTGYISGWSSSNIKLTNVQLVAVEL